MPFSVRIIESDKKIEKLIANALKKEIGKSMQKAASAIQRNLKIIVTQAIKGSPEYLSLVGGRLKFEFGLPDALQRIDRIIDIWTNNIQVTSRQIRVVGGTFAGGIVIKMFRSDYSDVLASNAAILTTEKGTRLNWLEWLLKFGDRTIVKEYEVDLGEHPGSRTGGAVMVQSRGRWKVPSEFAGTPRNNFLTRAMNEKEGEIMRMIEREIKAKF